MGTEAYITFRTKPFKGYNLGVEFAGRNMIAVPEKKLQEAKESKKDICVIDKTTREDKKNLPPYMILSRDEIALAFGEFPDKWGRDDTYTLHYFEWKPIVQSTLFN